jgi:pyrroloquinoline quinone biosynthesis protein D
MTTISDTARFSMADGVASETLGPGQDTVVLSLTSGYLYTCNETTAAFLKALDGRRTFAEVVDAMYAQFDVPRDTLRRDLARLAHKLLAEKLILEAD